MTFEEYMKSDDGMFQIDQFKKRKKIVLILGIGVLILSVLCMAFELVTELVQGNSANPTLDVLFYVSLGIGAGATLLLVAFLFWIRNMNLKCAKHLKKLVNLFWREHFIPWEKFLKGEEMRITVDHVYSYAENGKVLNLEKLKLSHGDPAFEGFSYTLEMGGWNDLLEGWIDAFLLSSMLPFLEHTKERGQKISTLRIEFTCEGKPARKKDKDDLYISKGKLTAQGKNVFGVAEILREKPDEAA